MVLRDAIIDMWPNPCGAVAVAAVMGVRVTRTAADGFLAPRRPVWATNADDLSAARRDLRALHALHPQKRALLDRDHSDLGACRAIVALDPPRTVADPDAAVAVNDRLFEKEVRSDQGVRSALREGARTGVEGAIDVPADHHEHGRRERQTKAIGSSG
jgi:hypothetical protein